MEAYESTCKKCGHKWQWVGYKTGIGKTPAQLEQMRTEGTVCPKCQGGAQVGLDHTSEFGKAMSEQVEFAVGLITGGPLRQSKPAPTEAPVAQDEDNYIVIYTGDHIGIEQMGRTELLRRLDENYYGPRECSRVLPKDRDPMYWGKSLTIIKGKIVQPQGKKVVQQYDIE